MLLQCAGTQTMNIKESFVASVTQSVQANGGTKWGEAESKAAVLAVVKAGAMESGLDVTEAQAICDNIAAYVGVVINPSAFAQMLEKRPENDPMHIKRPKRGSGGGKSALLDTI